MKGMYKNKIIISLITLTVTSRVDEPHKQRIYWLVPLSSGKSFARRLRQLTPIDDQDDQDDDDD